MDLIKVMKLIRQEKAVSIKVLSKLPDNLTVGGSLYLRGTGITSLPDNLTVGGHLDLQGAGITKPPQKKTYTGFRRKAENRQQANKHYDN